MKCPFHQGGRERGSDPMSHTRVNVDDAEASGPLRFMRDPLDCENLGFSVIEADAGWSGMDHDHADRDHEEVYHLVDGAPRSQPRDSSRRRPSLGYDRSGGGGAGGSDPRR